MWYSTKPLFGIVLAVAISAGASVMYFVVGQPTDLFGSSPDFKPGGVHGAPGPLMGAAGLPLLVAYGVYRMVSGRRKKLAE
jgi:hypothetical protein